MDERNCTKSWEETRWREISVEKAERSKNVGIFLSPYITFYGYKNIGQKNHFSEIGNFLFLLSDRETSSCNKGTITETKFFPVLGPLK